MYGARPLSTLCDPVLVANQPWIQITVQLWCVLMATFKGEPAARFRWKVGWSKHTTNHQFLKTRVVPISYFQDCIAMVFFPNCATSNAKSHRLPCHHCCLLNLQLKPACFQIPLSTVASAWLWAGCALNVLHAKKCPTTRGKNESQTHEYTWRNHRMTLFLIGTRLDPDWRPRSQGLVHVPLRFLWQDECKSKALPEISLILNIHGY